MMKRTDDGKLITTDLRNVYREDDEPTRFSGWKDASTL